MAKGKMSPTELAEAARCVNVLGRFLARRDVPALTGEAMEECIGDKQADLLILFGGSIVHGCRAAGRAYRQGIARRLMIVGGAGHTTEALRENLRSVCPQAAQESTEAEMLRVFLAQQYGIQDALLERQSSNCGNNVSLALQTAKAAGVSIQTVIIMQDSSMQRRMEAGFAKMWEKEDCQIINFAAYIAEAAAVDGALAFCGEAIEGMWDMERYITLLMGEIPRLLDTPEGYGPRGKNYIAHVDIPAQVMDAFRFLQARGVGAARPQWQATPSAEK